MANAWEYRVFYGVMVNVFVFVTPPDVTEMSTVWGAVTLAKAMVEFTRVLPEVATSTGNATRSGREADNLRLAPPAGAADSRATVRVNCWPPFALGSK